MRTLPADRRVRSQIKLSSNPSKQFMKRKFYFLVFLLSPLIVFSQDQHKIDSLQNELKRFESHRKELQNTEDKLLDTTAVNLLILISKCYRTYDIEKQIELARKALNISESINFKKGIANSFHAFGNAYCEEDSLKQSMEYNRRALEIRLQINDESGICASYNNIGIIYKKLNNLPEELKYYLEAMKIGEKINDRTVLAANYHNIGDVYGDLGNQELALDYFLKAKKLNIELGNNIYLARNLVLIGDYYAGKKNYEEALTNYKEAVRIHIEMEQKKSLIVTYNKIGELFRAQGKYNEAIEYYTNCFNLSKQIDFNDGYILYYSNVGEIYELQGKHDEALNYLNKNLSYTLLDDNPDKNMEAYKELAKVHGSLHHFEEAFSYLNLYQHTFDSLQQLGFQKKAEQLQMQYDFDKAQDSTKVEQNRKDAIAHEELQKQKLLRNGFIGGFAAVLLFAGIFFNQRNKIKKGKKLSDELLLNILPEEVAEELKAKGSTLAKQFDEVTVMFTDFKNFTQISEKLSPTELVAEIHHCFKAFDDIIFEHNIEKIKTIGDSYMCAGGLPVTNKTNAIDVVRAALEIQQFMQQHLSQRTHAGREPFEIRIGIHTGPVVAGIVGVRKFAYDIWGDTVNIASRMESSGEAGKVNISASTYELVKGEFSCVHRGKIQAKNKGEIDMYFVVGTLPAESGF